MHYYFSFIDEELGLSYVGVPTWLPCRLQIYCNGHNESNGLLCGIKPDLDYPVCTVPVEPFDRFLLYTDGMTEPENVAGEAFGNRQLEGMVRENRLLPASELSRQLLSEPRKWQLAAASQQDDITLIIVDVV